MATIDKKLIHFKTRSAFDTALANNQLNSWSIVFIKDTKEIWTHDQIYSCPYTKTEIDQLLENIIDSINLSWETIE